MTVATEWVTRAEMNEVHKVLDQHLKAIEELVGEMWEHVEDAESELQYVNAIRIGGWRPIRKMVVERGHQAIPGEER